MSSRIIIITTLALLLASFAALFVIEAKNHDYDYKKSWSVVYFENPGDNSLDFAIENHQGEKAGYAYKVLLNGKEEIKSEAVIEKGSTQEIAPVLGGDDLGKGGKVEIVVSRENTDYTIYKNLK